MIKENQEIRLIEDVQKGEVMKFYVSPLRDIGFFSVNRGSWKRVSEPIRLIKE